MCAAGRAHWIFDPRSIKHNIAHYGCCCRLISPTQAAKARLNGATHEQSHDTVWPCRNAGQPLGPTIAKMAPCGSRQWAIQLPPGTCMGPWMIWPPAPFTRAIAASTASTLK